MLLRGLLNTSFTLLLAFYVNHHLYCRVRTNQWYGIRYAQPPIGELRWQTPRDIEVHNNYSSSILDATVAGPSCVQGSPPWPGATFDPLTSESSEDCLLLNILAPIEPASATLPVLVQIHGGGKLGLAPLHFDTD